MARLLVRISEDFLVFELKAVGGTRLVGLKAQSSLQPVQGRNVKPDEIIDAYCLFKQSLHEVVGNLGGLVLVWKKFDSLCPLYLACRFLARLRLLIVRIAIT